MSRDRIRNFVVESEIRSLITIFETSFLLENQLENISIDSHQFITLFSILDEFNIDSSESHIEDDDIRNLVITSEIFDRIFTSRSNSNHLSASKIFQNSIYSASKSIVLFYSLDELDISLEVKFWIIISVKFLLITSTLKSFYLLETWFENSSIDHCKSISLFCLNDSLNKSNQKVIQHFNRIFSIDNLISISESFLILEKFQKLYLFVKQISLTSSASMMKLITFRIQISNQFFRSLISSFNTSTRIQYWNHSSFSRTLRNHIYLICKRLCFFCLKVELNIISSETTRIF